MIHRIERGRFIDRQIDRKLVCVPIYLYISIIIITVMVIVSIIIIRNQENSEALSAHSVWSQAHCPLHCPQYESTVNTE